MWKSEAPGNGLLTWANLSYVHAKTFFITRDIRGSTNLMQSSYILPILLSVKSLKDQFQF